MQTPSRVAVPPAVAMVLPPRRHVVHVVLVVAIVFLSLYISASIFLSVALTSLINVVGLVAALALWRIPRRALFIADAVLLGAIMILQVAVGFDLLALCLLGIVGVLALTRWQSAWLYLATGLVVVTAGWTGVTMGLNQNLVPRLFTEAVPGISLHLPPLVASLVMIAVALGLLTVGTWRVALRLDFFALALFVAAVAHLAAGVLGFVAMSLPSMLAEALPAVYSYDDESLAHLSVMISTLRMNAKGVMMAGIIPLALVIASIVRLARQPTFALRGAPTLPSSPRVALLTGVALAVPGLQILLLSLLGDDNPLQLVLPFTIDGSSLVLWIIAVVVWWGHTPLVRAGYAPGGDLTRSDRAATLLLAAAPGLLAVLDLGLTFIP